MEPRHALAAAVAFAVLILPLASGEIGTVALNVRGPSCNIDFVPGWNLVSLCSEPADNAITSVLAGLDYTYVQRWNTTFQDFEIYSPYSPSNPFTSLKFNESFFVYANSPGSVYVSNAETGDMNISLVEGWNTPSYPYNFTANISAYFNESSFYYVMKWNTTSQEFLTYTSFNPENPFTQISMSEGQFVYVYDPAGTVLAYNKSALNSS